MGRRAPACNIGEHIDVADGGGKTESAHGSRASAISVATSSPRGRSQEPLAPYQTKSPPDGIFADECVQLRLACSVGVSPTGGKVRNLRSLGRICGGNETDEADRRSHPRDGERVTGP
jgi:hypothetical protein